VLIEEDVRDILSMWEYINSRHKAAERIGQGMNTGRL
jgi:hypothetical protein